MNRRSILKAILIIPFIKLQNIEANTKNICLGEHLSVLVFKDTDQKIIVDQNFWVYVKSIQMLLEEFLGETVTALYDRRMHEIVDIDLNVCSIANKLHLFYLDEFEYNKRSFQLRRQTAEQHITQTLNRLQNYFVNCANIAQRLKEMKGNKNG